MYFIYYELNEFCKKICFYKVFFFIGTPLLSMEIFEI